MELPDRLKETGDEADEDVVPQQGGQQMFMNMNQSIFGLIAAAGSTVDFKDRFEGPSSDEDEADHERLRVGKSRGKEKQKEPEDLTRSQILKTSSSDKPEKKHRRRLSTQLLQSLPHLPRLSSRSKSKSSKLASPPLSTNASEVPQSLSNKDDLDPRSPEIEITRADRAGSIAPVMSRMLEARAEMAARPSFDLERLSGDMRRGGDVDTGDTELALRLKEIFEFDHPEKVLEGKWHSLALYIITVMLTILRRIPLLAPTKRTTSRLHVHYS